MRTKSLFKNNKKSVLQKELFTSQITQQKTPPMRGPSFQNPKNNLESPVVKIRFFASSQKIKSEENTANQTE